MLKGLLWAGCLVSAALSLSAQTQTQAQTRQGTITYERKANLWRRMQDEQMKAMVPQFQTAVYNLLFKDSISVYKAAPKDEAPDPFEPAGGGAHMVIRFSGPGDDGVLYKNWASARLLQEANLQDKQYIITDSILSIPWKLTDETSMIQGHPCKKAMAVSKQGGPVIAWYCQDIPVPVGPDQWGGLPGATLRLDIDSGTVVFTATHILPSVNAKELKAPTTGMSLTRAAFGKKLDEVMGPADSQGRRIIRN